MGRGSVAVLNKVQLPRWRILGGFFPPARYDWQMMQYYCYYESPLGRIRLASDGNSLVGLWFCGQKFDGAALSADAVSMADLPVFRLTSDWLDAYFAGRAPDAMDIPVNPAGTLFQRRVWDQLRQIPHGTCMTYGQLAARVHCTARPVGAAIGRNPISIIIPCHRVVGARGKLVGYAGGIMRKEKLLALEQGWV